jgi:hypothetical protein
MIASILFALRNVRIEPPRGAEPPDGGSDSFASAPDCETKPPPANAPPTRPGRRVRADRFGKRSWGQMTEKIVRMLDELSPVM